MLYMKQATKFCIMQASEFFFCKLLYTFWYMQDSVTLYLLETCKLAFFTFLAILSPYIIMQASNISPPLSLSRRREEYKVVILFPLHQFLNHDKGKVSFLYLCIIKICTISKPYISFFMHDTKNNSSLWYIIIKHSSF